MWRGASPGFRWRFYCWSWAGATTDHGRPGPCVRQFWSASRCGGTVQTGLPAATSPGSPSFQRGQLAVLALGDYFTYDYAYVRDLSEPYENVADFLRSFRDMGLGWPDRRVRALDPMIWPAAVSPARRPLSPRSPPWRCRRGELANVDRQPGSRQAPSQCRLSARGPFSLHGGYSQFLTRISSAAHLVELNGVDIVLLQEFGDRPPGQLA